MADEQKWSHWERDATGHFTRWRADSAFWRSTQQTLRSDYLNDLERRLREAERERDEARRGWAGTTEAYQAARSNSEAWEKEGLELHQRVMDLETQLREARRYVALYNSSADGHAKVASKNLLLNIDALIPPGAG